MVVWSHKNTKSDEMSEYVFLGLRRIGGIDLAHFQDVFGRDFWALYGEETRNLIGRGLLAYEDRTHSLKLTLLGLDLANHVFREYV